MPHTKSAKKALRQNERRRARNRATKKAMKKQIKAFLAALENGTREEAQEQFSLAAKRLDKAAARRVIHPNAAARKKSKLALKLNAKQ
ncbi:MAG TPA: 30S ribosomal protein S20 [Gemmataceae bacterium]